MVAKEILKPLILLALALAPVTKVFCEEDGEELAKQLANPVASLVSVPFQYNYDGTYKNSTGGPNGSKSTLNIQPVIPISIGEDWNVISRTIAPIVDEENVPPGTSQSGFGDITQSFFFSPKAPTSDGLIWGAGPAFLLATGSDTYLGGEKWGAGPTVVGLKQTGPWTYGLLANHIWSFAGTDTRSDTNATYIQPFLAYITSTKTTFTLNTESTYNWQGDNWNIPINATINQLLKVWDQPIQIGVGPRYWAESPKGGAEDWGIRAVFTLLFPK